VPKSWTWGRSYARFLRVIRIGRYGQNLMANAHP
jgi:hypothetical protein